MNGSSCNSSTKRARLARRFRDRMGTGKASVGVILGTLDSGAVQVQVMSRGWQSRGDACSGGKAKTGDPAPAAASKSFQGRSGLDLRPVWV